MKLLRYLKIVFMLLRFRLSGRMMYSVNFWSSFLVDVSVFLIQIIVFSAVFSQVDSINGWNRYQMIFFVGTFTIIDSLYMASYFFGVLGLPELVRTGKLDVYITKPVNTLFFISFEKIDPGALLLTIPGIMMLIYSIKHLAFVINAMKIAVYITLLVIMLILMFDLMVLIRTLAFRFIRTDALTGIENELVVFAFRIPGTVFKGISKLIFYVILPYGLIATIPTQYFTASLDLKYWILVLVVCAAFTVLCRFAWRLGLSRYGSASS